MKKRPFEAVAYSAAGIVLAAILAIGINLIFSTVRLRADLTADKIYTLSEGTRKVLSSLDTPVEIRFYYTKDDNAMPIDLKTYAERVNDLLSEYEKANPKYIKVARFNPEPDSDAEDSARLDGITGQQLANGDRIYLGLAVVCLDKKESIPFLAPNRENLLEYDITRAISNAVTTEKPVIGVMSALQVLGGAGNPMMQMGQQQPRQPWIAVSELKKDYDVQPVEMTAETIDENIKVLAVIHPSGITEQGQYLIDQFVMRGGKLIVFVDPLSLVQAQQNPPNPMMMMGQSFSSNLDKLFPAWGITYDPSKVIADMQFASRFPRPGGEQVIPVALNFDDRAMNPDDAASAEVTNLSMPAAGALKASAPSGMVTTILVHSSTDSQLVAAQTAQMGAFDQIVKDFKSDKTELPIALRITGKFKSAFPDGKPKATEDPANPDQPKPEEKKTDSLKESTGDPAVIVVGDADFIYDEFAFQVQQMFDQRIAIPRNSNLTFFQNLIDVSAGDSVLMSIRGRSSVDRPFTVVKDMQAKAEERFRSKIKEVEQGLQETQQRLSELQAGKQGEQEFILSPEQQQEIEKFQKQEAESRKELKRVRRELRAEIESLETRIMWLNIALIPFLVTLLGITLAIVRSRRRSAQ